MKLIEIEHERLNEGKLRYQHLLGLKFVHGEQDCFTLLQRIFMDNLNIKLNNYARPDDWWIQGMDLYMNNFSNEGFELIEEKPDKDYNPFDVFLIAIPDSRNPTETVANHCAIYLGEGQIIHHRLGKLSEQRPYRYSMKDYTSAVIRHKDVPSLINRKGTSVDILDYVLPHKRELVLGVMNEGKNRTR